jgi:hypothetical protein
MIRIGINAQYPSMEPSGVTLEKMGDTNVI